MTFTLTILQIFSSEVTLIHDQVWINVGAYDLRVVCTNVDQTLISDQRNFMAKYLQNDQGN